MIISKTFNAHSGRAWIAVITGPDAKFGLKRQFCSKRDVTVHRTNTYRTIEIAVEANEGDVIEWCCQESARRQEKGFWRITNGTLVEIGMTDVRASFAS